MSPLPLFVAGLLGGFVAYVVSLFDRGQPLMRLANYPIGVLAATTAAWISQNVPNMHNKLLMLGIFVPAIALMVYQTLRHFMENRRRLSDRVEVF